MKLISVNVARPRIVLWNGESVSTGIFKLPVAGRVPVHTLNLEGDRQADLTVHGGPTKAVYGYPSEHYDFWRAEFPEMRLGWGMFGENLTTEGLDEATLNIGDRLRVGTAELSVTQPRMPCHKLGIKFGRADIIKRFLQSGRSGFYFRVLKEGEVAAGDPLELLSRDEHNLTVADVVGLFVRDRGETETLRRASSHPALPEGWRSRFREQLERAGDEN
jgi:MOSC domain-containing protein YiiM